jgi:hypothetical protein
MKITFLSFLMLIVATFSNAQFVTIPDANFKNALLSEGVDIDQDGEISFTEAESVTFLNVIDKGISDMTGIEAFTSLEDLFCSKNLLTSLDVSHNTALITLGCDQNQLISLNVANDSNLYEMGISDNQLTSLDLTHNTALQILNCSNNLITSLEFPENTQLSRLDCNSNQLVHLDVSNNAVLEELICTNNQLDSLDVSENINLKYLYCNKNQLTSLDISNATSLVQLFCSENNLTGIDLSDAHLADLDCSFNQISALDVSNFAFMISLDCSNNQIASLDVTANTYLWYLYCNNNQLTTLDITNNTRLQVLNISSMPDLSKVCVWITPFPPNEVSIIKTDSPNIYYTTDCLATGINMPLENHKLNIYPNPSDGIINIDIENSNNAIMEIYDVNGMLLYSRQLKSKSEKTDISDLPKGVYMVKVKQDNSVDVRRVVKK